MFEVLADPERGVACFEGRLGRVWFWSHTHEGVGVMLRTSNGKDKRWVLERMWIF